MKLAHLHDALLKDINTIIDALKLDRSLIKSENGMKYMYQLLDKVSIDRAYDDTHPCFQSGGWKRILPFDGRKYCWYYENDCHDSHVATLLKKIKTEL